MRWIIRSSLRFRFLVIAAAVALMVFGAGQLENARTEAFPEFAPPRVEVQTITTGLSAEETEEFVTGPLEQTLNGVPELDIIRSTTVPQLSSIELIFNKGTDLLEARQVVQERLAGVTPTLPVWAAPPVIRPPLSAVARVMQIGVTSNADVAAAAVDDRLLEDQGTPAAGARSGERGDLGRASPAGARERRPGAHAGQEGVARQRHDTPPQTRWTRDCCAMRTSAT